MAREEKSSRTGWGGSSSSSSREWFSERKEGCVRRSLVRHATDGARAGPNAQRLEPSRFRPPAGVGEVCAPVLETRTFFWVLLSSSTHCFFIMSPWKDAGVNVCTASHSGHNIRLSASRLLCTHSLTHLLPHSLSLSDQARACQRKLAPYACCDGIPC
jgi:hypothetical protein